MIIYANSDACRWHLSLIGLNSTPFLDDLDQPDDLKLAVFHIPFPYTTGLGTVYEKDLDYALERCDRIAVLCSEIHSCTAQSIVSHQNPKIKYFLCGFVQGVNSATWMDWFITSGHFYKNNPNILDKLTPYTAKPKQFDILLGQPKAHRNAVYNYIKEKGFDDNVIMTYLHSGNKIIPNENTDEFIWEEDGFELIEKDIKWTVTRVKYHGQQMSLSQVIPISIYNQTAYTVVCETNFDNHYSFYTEKIVKPILAKRLFVLFGGQYYLQNLRSLGFKTFDGIIDESYDSVKHNGTRYSMACEQINYLMQQPQEEILDKIKPITEHNYRVMLDTNWHYNMLTALQAFLLDQLTQN